ncbi:hypothetical protein Hbl1158_00865 [Halobaculum sp. CBA1158]|uniref:hypothetical protein n=1 Tax=Halobaculum sp. CBA1158 TaxID=2904243 RepID=UPI001F220728|nr:hypothetical protein [Halobaculum sp. CBA1158]UIO99958.1 hypothetical protein Hbl1158_00865 [Halobaculum sp. CBA1158]
MHRRALSLGGFVVAGVSQLLLGVAMYAAGDSPANPLFSVLGGLLVAGVFTRALLQGNDLNGLATRPLFVAVGVASGVLSAVLTGAVLFGA